MNPFPVIQSMFQRQRFTLIIFMVLIAFSVALGVAITAQERALRQGSARASDKFDLIVGAPGSQYDLVLASVYLRTTSMELLRPKVFAQLLDDPKANWVAPIAFGDNFNGYPVIGTTAQFVLHLADQLNDGRMFASQSEVVVGADVVLDIGKKFRTLHGVPGFETNIHQHVLEVVGRMARTHTPWDRAIIAPVEQMWETHNLPFGHNPFASNERTIGAPFDRAFLPGVPAVVVSPRNVAAAYSMRSAYRTEQSQALFPAEILIQLYALMGDARAIMQVLALATQALVIVAILSGLLVIIQLYTSRLATLRALGATRRYIFVVTWTYVMSLVGIGALVGLAMGYGAAQLISAYLVSVTGFAVTATLGVQEFTLVASLLGLSALFALIPAFAIFRRPVIDALR